jgi:hypothetical protein
VQLARTPGQAGSASYQYEHTTIFLIEYAKLISVQFDHEYRKDIFGQFGEVADLFHDFFLQLDRLGLRGQMLVRVIAR